MANKSRETEHQEARKSRQTTQRGSIRTSALTATTTTIDLHRPELERTTGSLIRHQPTAGSLFRHQQTASRWLEEAPKAAYANTLQIGLTIYKTRQQEQATSTQAIRKKSNINPSRTARQYYYHYRLRPRPPRFTCVTCI